MCLRAHTAEVWRIRLEVLETVKVATARQLVERMARGRPDDWVTRNAKAVLARMESAR